jgi:RNA polymerase sigma-70 factor (ECF subfamily)
MLNENDINLEYIISELQKGEEKAFDFIFRKYYKALCAQAVSYVNDLDLAQSLVQECFICLWEKRDEAHKINKLSSYLVSMVRNRCIDYLRKTKKTEKINSTGILYFANLEDETQAHEFEEHLILALASLPERTREAFEYSRFECLTYKEIAEKMGISLKAVEALISRALIVLRRELNDFIST